ncbi:MAG: multicopper oxidase domain-containing protein [Chloroflexi bacterium]|nr:multicopper oxidase domain-containing protein [Chloroflexota bacterium]
MELNNLTRRNFLKLAGVAGLGAGLSACAGSAPVPPTPTAMTAAMDMTPTTGDAAADMDALHEAGVKTFLDGIGKDKAFWGTKLDYKMDGGVKVFEVTASDLSWEVAPGQTVEAMAYNGIVPGPEIRITEGDQVRVILKNEMKQSTAIHWHGALVPNAMDGVPFITQKPVKTGETFTYEFTARNPGSHMYHSHHNAAEQVTKGLMGAFIIEPKDKSIDPQYDAEYTMVLNDSGIGLTINGKSFPYTQPIVAKLGDKIRVRYMNEGLLIHPMHLHGIPQKVFAKDGWNLQYPYMADTVLISPGERYDVLVECTEPGAWAFHCHILTHAESSHGMFGMVTALVVQQ